MLMHARSFIRLGLPALLGLILTGLSPSAFAQTPAARPSSSSPAIQPPTLAAPYPATAAPTEAGAFADALVFDSLIKEYQGKPGDTNFPFTFAFTNNAPVAVVIEGVRTSCGCTVAKVPQLPWTIPAGERGEFSVSMDGRGKHGTISKTVYVTSSVGSKALTVRAVIAEDPATSGPSGPISDDRMRNMQIAAADRFAIFRGDCATCHAKPAEGKLGAALYVSACGVCHESQNRGSMVPDLKHLDHPTDREHWLQWVTFGRHGSLMPAFAQSEGGILSEFQIDTLADYLSRTINGTRLTMAPRPLTSGVNAQPPPLPGSPVRSPVRPPARPTPNGPFPGPVYR